MIITGLVDTALQTSVSQRNGGVGWYGHNAAVKEAHFMEALEPEVVDQPMSLSYVHSDYFDPGREQPLWASEGYVSDLFAYAQTKIRLLTREAGAEKPTLSVAEFNRMFYVMPTLDESIADLIKHHQIAPDEAEDPERRLEIEDQITERQFVAGELFEALDDGDGELDAGEFAQLFRLMDGIEAYVRMVAPQFMTSPRIDQILCQMTDYIESDTPGDDKEPPNALGDRVNPHLCSAIDGRFSAIEQTMFTLVTSDFSQRHGWLKALLRPVERLDLPRWYAKRCELSRRAASN